MKRIAIISAAVAAMLLSCTVATGAQKNAQAPQSELAISKTDTFQIIEDTTKDGVRHIKAVPCKKVCSALIEFDIKNNRIYNLVYTRGCDGNLQAVGKLVEGMKVSQAIKTLSGINCAGRGTSCTDQLAQILKSLK